LITAGLFIAGGFFAYYVAFKHALVFLLSLSGEDIKNQIEIGKYFDTFLTVMLGSSLLFLMPIAVFFSTLLRLTTPGFLMRHSRYAVLAIVTLAAVVTPTPDPINLAILAVPLLLLYFLGVFGSYLLVLNREGQEFPWKAFFIWFLSALAVVGAVVAWMVNRDQFHFINHWPFLTQ
ncbi:MAG: twin-arginine translocase subunit TatC, partial [Acidobacteriota bacterium]